MSSQNARKTSIVQILQNIAARNNVQQSHALLTQTVVKLITARVQCAQLALTVLNAILLLMKFASIQVAIHKLLAITTSLFTNKDIVLILVQYN
jgi:hypothetical protein